MELDEALRLRKWMSLSKIGENVEAISGGFFSLGANLYASTRAYNKNLERDDQLAPFITGVYWAASVAAIKWVYLNSDLPSTSDTSLATPPQELLLGTSGTYSELQDQTPKSGNRIFERAEYSNKGLFLFKELNIDGFKYLFFENKNKPKERVSVIGFSLQTE
ncbi:MAG: hypothetical protein WA071_23225 [Undibacterium umbellatum]|uniref:hypothetical protein n=1 Tax=Undibacterium umbellatum TaxID=2762300 RepID=UPI003BB62C4E